MLRIAGTGVDMRSSGHAHSDDAKSEGFLRWRIDDINAWTQQVQTLREELEIAQGAEQISRALGRLGDALRLSSADVAEAIVVLERACIEAERAQHLVLLATNRVRFAIALQCADRHEEAIAQHEAAIDLIDTQRIRRLKDFALQHLGKCHVDRGDFETARQCFQRALRLRKRRGDIELIASTELALAELERLDSAMNQGNT